ncbi:MAG: glycine/betaine ABC transporter permease [Gracilibacter sp. BRH_c7a]|nr:MAG: glycine/betaine ABC transporter permease [Gracilibacter sp. BRH_c7a]
MKKNIVFKISISIVLLFVIIGLYSPDLLDTISLFLHIQIISNFGWIYHLAAFFFLVFCIILAFGRYGKIRLGKDDEKPQYSYFGWFSMLFAAGMGIGLIFWGVAEPLSHYLNPPAHMSPRSGESAAFAMRYSFFHWGLQPWAVYIVMSLALAYFTYRRNMPPLISSCFYPLLGDRIYSTPGHIINILSVIATVFGVATSLGLGALQIGSGLQLLYGIPDSVQYTIIIIAVVTVLYLLSSFIGLDKGIQTLSKFNMYVALGFLVVMLVVGPTSYIFNVFISSLGQYINQILEMSLQTFPFQGYEWSESWTLFYWAWWIAWAPFVGLFVARISRGRTIKEFVIGTLLAPTLLTFLWFSAFGGTALYLEIQQKAGFAEGAVADVSTALFRMLDYFPFSSALSLIAVILLLIFFVTSADSATFVLGMMTSNGDLNPPSSKKIAWGLTQSTLAGVLLISGGLIALQRMAIAAALPFTIIMILMCYNLMRGLAEEDKYR